MLYVVVAAGLEDVVETDEVALDVCAWVGDAVTHASLGCKVYDNVWLVAGKELVHQCLVGNVALDEGEVSELTECCKALFLDVDVVVVVHVVDADDVCSFNFGKQSLAQITANETGCTS